MEFTMSLDAVRQAVRKLQVYVGDPKNRFPYLTLIAEGETAIVCGTDSLSFVEVSVPANVQEAGSCLLGDRFDKLLSNMQDEEATFKVSSNTLSIKGSRGFRGRLQTVEGQPVPRDIFLEKLSKVQFVFEAVLFKSDLLSLIRLSEMLPPAEGTYAPWVIFRLSEGTIVGATQATDVGAVEAIPMTPLAMTGAGSAEFTFSTAFFKSLINMCDTQVRLRTGLSILDPLHISDPMNDAWWSVMMGIKRDRNPLPQEETVEFA